MGEGRPVYPNQAFIVQDPTIIELNPGEVLKGDIYMILEIIKSNGGKKSSEKERRMEGRERIPGFRRQVNSARKAEE